MEDPWGSPWTADSAPPKIDLPTPPPSAHFSLENHIQTRQRSPERVPWEDNDPWGGWHEAGADRISPSWQRSPGLEPIAGSSSSRQVSPGPWKLTHFDNAAKDEARSETLEAEKEERNGHRRTTTSELEASPSVSLYAEEPATSKSPATPSLKPIGAPQVDWEEDEHNTPTQARAPSPVLEVPEPRVIPVTQQEAAPDTSTRPEVTRQTSKVQELVEMYDGIAKRTASPAPSGLCTPPRVKRVEGLTDAATRELLGLEGSEEMGQDPVVIQFANKPSSDGGQAPLFLEQGEDKTSEDVVMEGEEPSSPSAQEQMSLSIDIDLTKLDDLFPTTNLPRIDPEPVPDVIIDDTFSSISERKAWYRISRYGSIWKHNHGDEENYRGITWNNSEVRTQAIRIVRRWMEEDSIAGRVVLGRRTGPMGASMFNWDSKAPAVGIGELLAKKSNYSHSRQASKVSRTSVDIKSAEPSPSVASFGWASGPFSPPTEDKTQAAAATQKHTSLPPPMASQNALQQGLDAGQLTRPSSLASPPERPESSSVTKPPVLTLQEEADDDDEDEWGEMVSTPTKDDFKDCSTTPEPVGNMAAGTNGASIGFLDNSIRNSPNLMSQTDAQSLQSLSNAKAPGFDMLAEGADGSEASTSSVPTKPVTPEETQPLEELDLDKPMSPVDTHGPRVVPDTHASAEHDDAAVAEILKSLPDLTYMLR